MTANILAQAQAYKTQLDSFLERKFLDHTCLLGLNSMVQSKFQGWITNDFLNYYNSVESPVPNNQLEEFDTISLLEKLWLDFHYPIIKFFQQQHAIHYQQVHSSFKESLNLGHRSKGSSFKVKPVEMRKINDSFTKLIKDVFQFYRNILKHFATTYQNSLLPQSLLLHFKFDVSSQAKSTSDSNVQANILYLIHKCLLALGDVSRHKTFIEVSFVNPCISNKEFFRHKSMTAKEKSIALKPFFERSIQYYQFCILLLPALNEPYNHIGVIFNIIEDKYNAVLWLLRSQFTRIPDFQLGLANLNRILSKDTFTNELLQLFHDKNDAPKMKSNFNTADDLNTMLICLAGYYYLPGTYRNGPNIVKKLTYSKVEGQFFNTLLDSFEQLYQIDDDASGSFFIKQITTSTKFHNFIFRYIEYISKGLASLNLNQNSLTHSLMISRLILTWLSENNVVLRGFQARKYTVEAFIRILKVYLAQAETSDIRNYYFREDVLFRDFSVIKYQFKDFDDNHLFKSKNFNLLLGDYSSYMDGKNNLRLGAVLVSSSNIFEKYYDQDSKSFVKVDIAESQNLVDINDSQNEKRLDKDQKKEKKKEKKKGKGKKADKAPESD
ncbi:uncharacterized protein CANTADRAFT_43725, partial [Suhomyces tanzawaensis NRRL Y-17324]